MGMVPKVIENLVRTIVLVEEVLNLSHHGSHSSSHTSHHSDKSSHHKSSSSNKDANKRRLSDADHPSEMGPKNKVPKMTENAINDVTKIKKEPGLTASSEMKMGRIPKIKKPDGSQTVSSEAGTG